MNKPLSQLTNELGQLLENRHNRIFDAMYTFAEICPTCHKLITNRTSLYIMAQEGECPGCSHTRINP